MSSRCAFYLNVFLLAVALACVNGLVNGGKYFPSMYCEGKIIFTRLIANWGVNPLGKWISMQGCLHQWSLYWGKGAPHPDTSATMEEGPIHIYRLLGLICNKDGVSIQGGLHKIVPHFVIDQGLWNLFDIIYLPYIFEILTE